MASASDGSLYVLLKESTGAYVYSAIARFDPAGSITPIPIAGANGLLLDDLDGDGIMDLVAGEISASGNSFGLRRGLAGGGFAPTEDIGPGIPVAFLRRGVGGPDIPVYQPNHTYELWNNDGTGGF